MAVSALVLTALATVRLAGDGSSQGAEGQPPSSAARSTPVATRAAAPARRAASVVVPEEPSSLRLPSGATVRVVAVSTAADGTLAVPADVRVAGWWRGGSRIGDPFGSTVIAAHVDSTTQGLGPYVELLDVAPDEWVVLTSTHLEQTFAIRSLRLVPRAALVRHSEIFSAGGARRLTLVTCAPPYDRSRGGYQQLAVVTAVALSGPRGRTMP